MLIQIKSEENCRSLTFSSDALAGHPLSVVLINPDEVGFLLSTLQTLPPKPENNYLRRCHLVLGIAIFCVSSF